MSLARSKWCRQIRLKKCAVHRIATPTTTVLNKARHSHGLYVRDVDGIIAEGSVAWAPHNSKGSKQNGAVRARSAPRAGSAECSLPKGALRRECTRTQSGEAHSGEGERYVCETARGLVSWARAYWFAQPTHRPANSKFSARCVNRPCEWQGVGVSPSSTHHFSVGVKLHDCPPISQFVFMSRWSQNL